MAGIEEHLEQNTKTGYYLRFYKRQLPIHTNCNVCMLAGCTSCSQAFFYIGDIKQLKKLYDIIESKSLIIQKNINIFYEPGFIIPILPLKNVLDVYGVNNKSIVYPENITQIHLIINYTDDCKKFILPFNLHKLYLDIVPYEKIRELNFDFIPLNVKELIINFSFKPAFKAEFAIINLPDGIEIINLILSTYESLEPPIFISRITKLPKSLKVFKIDTVSLRMSCFSSSSRVELESANRRYFDESGANGCLYQLEKYCRDHNIIFNCYS